MKTIKYVYLEWLQAVFPAKSQLKEKAVERVADRGIARAPQGAEAGLTRR